MMSQLELLLLMQSQRTQASPRTSQPTRAATREERIARMPRPETEPTDLLAGLRLDVRTRRAVR